MHEMSISKAITTIVIALVLLLSTLFGVGFLYKSYKVWSKEMDGKATLAEQEWTKKVQIEQAKAEKESAKLKAEAEVERAKGIAKANEIISTSITTEYIQYKFVEGLNDGNTEVIYVPTESNLPVLEAGRHLNDKE